MLTGKWISFPVKQPIGNSWRWVEYPARVRHVAYDPTSGNWQLLVETKGRLLSKSYREVTVIDDRRVDELARNEQRRRKARVRR